MDLPLPCPLEAFQPKQDRLWLLSDAPIGHLVPWGDWRNGSRVNATRCDRVAGCC